MPLGPKTARSCSCAQTPDFTGLLPHEDSASRQSASVDRRTRRGWPGRSAMACVRALRERGYPRRSSTSSSRITPPEWPPSRRRGPRADGAARASRPRARKARAARDSRGSWRLPSGREDHDARVGAAADRVPDGNARAVDLACIGTPAELPGELDDLSEGGGAQRLPFREEPPARIDGKPRAHRAAPAAHPLPAATPRAEAQLLHGEDLAARVRVLDLGHVDVL